MPTVPQSAEGMRIEPPWSPPIASSTSPWATSAAEPEEDPPAECPWRWGLCTRPVTLVWLPPDAQRFSQCALPAISTPASSSRGTMLASTSATKPSRIDEPFSRGTPASMTLSFRATRWPASGPSSRVFTAVRTYQAFSGFSSALGCQ